MHTCHPPPTHKQDTRSQHTQCTHVTHSACTGNTRSCNRQYTHVTHTCNTLMQHTHNMHPSSFWGASRSASNKQPADDSPAETLEDVAFASRGNKHEGCANFTTCITCLLCARCCAGCFRGQQQRKQECLLEDSASSQTSDVWGFIQSQRVFPDSARHGESSCQPCH